MTKIFCCPKCGSHNIREISVPLFSLIVSAPIAGFPPLYSHQCMECGLKFFINDGDLSFMDIYDKKKFCRKCGSQLPSDAVFCSQCGCKVLE